MNFNDAIQELTDNLFIDRNALDTMIESHPLFYHLALDAYAEACNIRDGLKDRLEKVYAQVSSDTRQDLIRSGAKTTEEQIRQKVVLDTEYQRTQADLLESKKVCDKLLALKESYSSRGYMLRELAGLWAGGYFADNTISNTAAMEKTGRYNKARDAIAKRRITSTENS